MRNTTKTTTTLKYICCALAIWWGAKGFAQDPNQSATPVGKATKSPKGDGKVDISDLETKYWAPKDTDFSVVQNRTYSKDNRIFASLQYGLPVNGSYSTGSLYGLTGNYFFSERYGIQMTGILAKLRNNQTTNDMATYGSGIQPDHTRLDSHFGVGFNFVPFYAKMSFLGSKIIYFDMAITPTIGITRYHQIMLDSMPLKSTLSYGVDITQYFFFTNWFAIRADLKNQWSSQDVVKYKATNSSGTYLRQGDPVASKLIHDTLFLIGATFYY